ncbi:hypothetical protein WA588_001663 [Blastocystis sp. NMH]
MKSSSNTSPGIGIWRICQVASLLYIIVSVISMIATSKRSTFGMALFFILLWNVLILLCLFIWFIINYNYFADSDLFHGMYCGVTLMEAFNLVAGAVLLFAESIAVKGVEGAGKARISYIILSILSIVLAALQFLYVNKGFYSKRK